MECISRLITKIKGIGCLNLVVFLFVAIIFGKSVFGILMNVMGPEIVIKPLDYRIGIRGALIDGQWYNPEGLYEEGNWLLEPDSHVISSVNGESCILKFPVAKEYNLVFDVGPDQGKVEVHLQNNIVEIDCYNEFNVDVGKAYPLELNADKMRTNILFFKVAACLLGIITTCTIIYLTILYKEYKNKINWGCIEKIYIVALFPVVFVFLAFFSVSSSPLVPDIANYWGEDGSFYTMLGKVCANGGIPYVDIFEQKGPFLFLIYTVGYMISPRWGVFLLQGIFVYSSFLFSYFIGKCFGNTLTGIIASIASFLYYVLTMDEGALVEDFNLPFLMMSTLITIKYIQNIKANLNVKIIYGFIYGLTVGISLGFRVTNCISICCFVLCLFIFLLKKKQYKNIIQNAITFILGFLSVVVPCIIYFGLNGALYDLLYGTILFSLQYTEVAFNTGHSLEELMKMIIYLMPPILCMFFSLEQKNLLGITMFVSAFITVCLMSRLYFFPHYYIVLLIFVPVVAGLFMHSKKCLSSCVCRYKVSYCFLMSCILIIMFNNIYHAGNNHYWWVYDLRSTQTESDYVQAVKEQSSLIPDMDKEAVIGYNVRPDWYLISDINPCFKYYAIQDSGFALSDQYKQENVEFYNSLSAKWIVVQGEVLQDEINDIIDTSYELYNSVYIQSRNSYFNLYRLKV